MKYEFHAVQSFAPANLNRDDLGLPKECTFGGVRRARVSSQSWKRAMRQAFQAETEGLELGVRTKRAHQELVDRQLGADAALDPDLARHRAAVLLEAEPLGLSLKLDDDSAQIKTGQLLFFRGRDLDTLAQIAARFSGELDALPASVSVGADAKKQKKGSLSKDAAAAVKTAMITPSAAIDVALFGRMIAEMPESNVDASCQVAHAIGTHRLEAEDDFFTAVDDLRPEETEGADMLGNVAYNASCLYRYAVLDAKQLALNLGVASPDDPLVRTAVGAFARAFATSIPTGKQNTFAAQNPPTSVLAVSRASGAWNLANAFVDPVAASGQGGGVDVLSTHRMLGHFGVLNRQFGRDQDQIKAALLTTDAVTVPEGIGTVQTLDELAAHVGGTA